MDAFANMNIVKPIPLELLAIREMEEVIPSQGSVKRSSSSLIPLRGNNAANRQAEGWPITFRHLGKMGYELTLFASNQSARKKWLEFIDTAQAKLRARGDFFNTTIVSSNFFTSTNRVNCVAPFGTLFWWTPNYCLGKKIADPFF